VAIELRLGEHGKPRLADGPQGLEFNLSHCGELALVAVSEARPVGIDVERIDSSRDLLALAKRELDPGAVEAVSAAAESDRADIFYAAWVRHEARLKCLGVGLGSRPPATELAVAPIELEGHAAAVAIPGSAAPLLRRRSL
jgi:4'-phosphopantetheinyl transferase